MIIQLTSLIKLEWLGLCLTRKYSLEVPRDNYKSQPNIILSNKSTLQKIAGFA